MANIATERLAEPQKHPRPMPRKSDKQLEQVRKRAFELFETRRRVFGDDFDDRIRAEYYILRWPAAELAASSSASKLEMTLPVFDPKQTEVAARPCAIVAHVEIKGEKKREQNILWTGFGPNDVYCRLSSDSRST